MLGVEKMKKKLLSVLLTLIFVCSIGNTSYAWTESGIEAVGIKSGEYYYLKNIYSGLYLTIDAVSDVSDAYAIQSSFRGTSNQKFKIEYLGNGSYILKPLVSSSGKVLDVFIGNSSTAGQTPGTPVGMFSYNGGLNQKFLITGNLYGFELLARCSHNNFTETLRIGVQDASSGSQVVLVESNDELRSVWTLEPAVSGNSTYYGVTTLNPPDTGIQDRIVNTISAMGYQSKETNLPTASHLYNDLKNNTISIIHGHGNKGLLRVDQPDGSFQYLYSSRSVSDSPYRIDNYPYNALAKNHLIVYIVCFSAANPNNGFSMAEASKLQGASCTIGFRNEVAGGGQYTELLMNYINSGYTIAEAQDLADYDFIKQYGNSGPNSPANTGNRACFGHGNKNLDLR